MISKPIICQTTNMKLSEPTKCIPVSQVNEIYKGLKQNEQLKKLFNSAQETIENSNSLIASQKRLSAKLTEESEAKSQVITNLKDLNEADKKLCDIQKESLQSDIKYLETQSKRDSRRSFWNGVKIGGFSLAVIGAVGFVLIK